VYVVHLANKEILILNKQTGIDWIMITMNCTLIGLNWTESLKHLEIIFVMIWRFINKLN